MSAPKSAGTSPERSSSSTLLRKLKLPFSHRNTLQIHHEIELDQPFRRHAPGETVSGAVHLHVVRPTRATHLIVRLLGYIKVSQHTRLSNEPLLPNDALLVSSTSPLTPEYLGNGCLRLFEDECVLCGDGRLLGQYVFRFHLVLPEHGLPSSIDFENGSISYVVASTLTRPTSIAPTLRRETKINVRENIDVALFPPPAPQHILVETIRKRKTPLGLSRTASGDSRGSSLASGNSSMVSVSPSDLPRDGCQNIKARTEILKGGFLSGDSIPVRISIEHNKVIKSMQGLIASLYRLAVVDSNPNLVKGPLEKDAQPHRDPASSLRSTMGLSPSTPRRVFRQDLAQSITPIVIDPATLTSNIRTSIKIPDLAFPTIKNVPGSIVSFRYFLEIIVDLRGKLGQDKLLQRFNMTSTVQHAYGGPQLSIVDGAQENTFSATAGFNYLITDQIRRQKGVFSTNTEIIIGTIDTSKVSEKSKIPEVATRDHGANVGKSSWPGPPQPLCTAEEVINPSPSPPAFGVPNFPLPRDEKSRVRWAEEALLPSAPPGPPAPAYTGLGGCDDSSEPTVDDITSSETNASADRPLSLPEPSASVDNSRVLNPTEANALADRPLSLPEPSDSVDDSPSFNLKIPSPEET